MKPISFRDPAELPQASIEDHPADRSLQAYCDNCKNVVDPVCPACKRQVCAAGATTKDGSSASQLTQAEFYRRFIHLVSNSRQPKFTLVCYYIATGDAYADGISMTEVAKRWGVSKAMVSKNCRAICAYLQIRPSRYMRREEAAAKFRISNRRPRKE